MVTLYFYDDYDKRTTFCIPEEFAAIDIIDINIAKVFLDKPIGPSAFFRMSSWLLQQFDKHEDAVFTFICSTEELDTNHPDKLPQDYRWELFNRLYARIAESVNINVQDVVVGPDGFQSFGRAFYRDKHAPIIHFVASYLKGKQADF